MPATDSSQTLTAHVQARSSPRIFLDTCCGFHRPLSKAMRNLGADVLSLDKLFNLQHDLLDFQFMETLLRRCASGIASYTAASHCQLEPGLVLRQSLSPPDLSPSRRKQKFLHHAWTLSLFCTVVATSTLTPHGCVFFYSEWYLSPTTSTS